MLVIGKDLQDGIGWRLRNERDSRTSVSPSGYQASVIGCGFGDAGLAASWEHRMCKTGSGARRCFNPSVVHSPSIWTRLHVSIPICCKRDVDSVLESSSILECISGLSPHFVVECLMFPEPLVLLSLH